MDMKAIGELMSVLQEMDSMEDLKINSLDIVLGKKKDGILLKISSPDKDGAKLAGQLGKMFAKLPGLLASQAPDIKVNLFERDIE